MAHHKRKRHPNARAGCAMCKPHKKGGGNPDKKVWHKGFGKLRDLANSEDDMNIDNALQEISEMNSN